MPSLLHQANRTAALAGASRTQPCDTAMPRCGNVVEAVNGVAVEVEEHRIRHEGVFVFLGMVIGIHAVDLEHAVGVP